MIYTIISAREEGMIGKGDQVVLRQIRRVLEMRGEKVQYVQIKLDLKKLLKRSTISSIIYISILDLIWAFLYIIIARWPVQTAIFSNPRLARKLQRLTLYSETQLILSQERTHGFRRVQSNCLLFFIDALAYNLRSRTFKNRIIKIFVNIEAKRLQKFATDTPEHFIKMFVTDQEKKHYNLKNSVSVPNYLEKNAISGPRQCVPNNRKRLVLSGNFYYRPNFEAADWLLDNLKLIQKATAESFDVVFAGLGSDRYLGAAQNLVCIPEVSIMKEALQTCDCAIAPMQSGSGIQNKILEALGAGLPCIASPVAHSPFVSAYGNVGGVLSYSSVDELAEKLDLVFSGKIQTNRNELIAKLSLEASADRIYENLFKR